MTIGKPMHFLYFRRPVAPSFFFNTFFGHVLATKKSGDHVVSEEGKFVWE